MTAEAGRAGAGGSLRDACRPADVADFTWIRKGRGPLVAFVETLGYSRAIF